jgi:hypothetical protein
MTMTESYPEDWEARARISTWWDPDDIVDLHADDDARDGLDDADDPGPWDLAG